MDFSRHTIVVKFKTWDDSQVEAAINQCGAVLTKSIPQIKYARASVPEGADALQKAEAALSSLRAHPLVENAYPESTVEMVPTVEYFPANDPLLMANGTWHMWRLGVYHAWRHLEEALFERLGVHGMLGDPAVCVTFVGTGWVPHEDAKTPIWERNSFTGSQSPNSALDLSVMERSDIYAGSIRYSHETMVASFVSAKYNNSVGTAGITPDCSVGHVMHDKTEDDAGEYIQVFVTMLEAAADFVAVSDGFTALGKKGIINNSWRATGEPEQAMADAIAYCIAHDHIVTAAAANDALDLANYAAHPMQYPGVICVGATIDQYDDPVTHANTSVYRSPSWGTNYGTRIDIAAPGSRLTVPKVNMDGPFDQYFAVDGTSLADPIVCGVLATIRSVNPSLTASESVGVLRASCDQPRTLALFNQLFPQASGVAHAVKAAITARTTLAANAGRIFPYISAWGSGATNSIVSGDPSTSLNGNVTLEISGYSSVPVNRVELWLGSELIYDGACCRLNATASNAGTLRNLKVVAHTASGSAGETFTDVQVSSLKGVTGVTLLPQTWPPPQPFTPPAGRYQTAQTVTLTGTGIIYYTLDGSTPTAETGTLYTGPFMVGTGTTTVKFITVSGGVPGEVQTAVYEFELAADPATIHISDTSGELQGVLSAADSTIAFTATEGQLSSALSLTADSCIITSGIPAGKLTGNLTASSSVISLNAAEGLLADLGTLAPESSLIHIAATEGSLSLVLSGAGSIRSPSGEILDIRDIHGQPLTISSVA